MLSEAPEHAVRRNLVLHPHCEPVLKEDVDARPKQATLPNLVAPPLFVELGASDIGPLLRVSAKFLAALEHPVLDEVRSEEGGAAVVQRLENELIIVRK